MKMTLKLFAATALMALSATAARAEPYIGNGIGLTWMAPTVAENYMDSWHRDNYGAGINCEVLDCNTPANMSGTLKIFGGYRVNSYFAVEGFAVKFNRFSITVDDGADVSADSNVDIGTFGAAAIGMYPLPNGMSLLGKFGLHSWRAKGDVALVDSGLASGLTASFNVSDIGQMGGIGLQIDFDDIIAARVEYELFGVKITDEASTIGFLSISAMYKF